MQTGRTVIIGRGARLVLLACTLFGLAAMHTIGHSGMTHSDHHSDALPAGSLLLSAMSAITSAGPDGCAGDGCVHAAAFPAGGSPMDRWGLCVAVLGALAIALLLAALLMGAVTGRFPPRSRTDQRRQTTRAPPFPGFGLTLAGVSVLRT